MKKDVGGKKKIFLDFGAFITFAIIINVVSVYEELGKVSAVSVICIAVD